MNSGDWDELRREARRLEGDLDVRLSSYAKLGGLLSLLLLLFPALISSPFSLNLLALIRSGLCRCEDSGERVSLEVDGDGDREPLGAAT